MLFTDHELQSTEYDEALYHEHSVHPTILAYRAKYGIGKALNVLVLGAGEGATIRELLKYDESVIKNIVWDDVDQDLCILCKEHLSYCANDPNVDYTDGVYNSPDRVSLMYVDANLLLVDDSIDKFDIVICDLPDPDITLPWGESLYSNTFWKNVYAKTNEQCIIQSHAGPCAPGKADMELVDFVKEGMKTGGFVKPILGKVLIPSFQSEWAYVLASKDEEIVVDAKKWAELMPKTGMRILDEESINAFFNVPKYYFDYAFDSMIKRA